jgi:starch-binding outer membrane protein, SusD/RagB family
MKSKIYILVLLVWLGTGCSKEFLDRGPLDQESDNIYWSNEKNVRTFAYGFYTTYFVGYGTGFAFGDYFYQGQSLNDDFAPTSPPQFVKIIPASGGGWSFTNVRKANIMLNRVQNMSSLDEVTKKHWMGIARFFRGMAYYRLVKAFGDVPWYGYAMDVSEEAQLYKPRDPRTLVMDSVLLDFKYASENVRAADGEKGLNVTKWVVEAFMSRVFLFEGTWQKYHLNNAAKAQEYLLAAKAAADDVITNGGYSFNQTYRESFNNLDLSKNTEIIMYRRYATGLLTHSLNSYVNGEGQTGPNKNLMEAYLCTDGRPIGTSAVYQGDKTNEKVRTNRDPRLLDTFNPELRPPGSNNRYNKLGTSTSGYCTWKFLNDAIRDLPEGSSSVNPTHAPVIRLGEVLINYAEAAAETGAITQPDLDKSINKLRARPSGTATKVPSLQVLAGQPAIGGVVYTDPKRDPTVSEILWEIRRERRVELAMEGLRLDDLKRWKKLAYVDNRANPDLNRGCWINRAEWAKVPTGSWLSNVTLEGGGQEGYIIPAPNPLTDRLFIEGDKLYTKWYLDPLPLDQIKLYKDKGVDLLQNPDWVQ